MKAMEKVVVVMLYMLLSINIGFAWSTSEDTPKAHFAKGLLHEYTGKLEQAVQEYNRAIELDTKAFFVYRHAIKLLLQLGKVSDALDLAKKLTKADPKDSDNWVLFAGALWVNDKSEESVKAYQKALELSPNNTDALYQAASLLSGTEPKKAEEYLKRYIKESPGNSAEAYYQLALLSFQQKKATEAIGYLKQSIEKFPEYLQPRYALGQLHEIKGDVESALNAYEEITAFDDTNPDLFAHIGELYLSLEKNSEAEINLQKAKHLDGSHAKACGLLAVLAEKRSDFEQAIKYLRKSSSYDSSPGLWLRESYNLTQLEKINEAVLLLEKAHKKWPDNVEIAYYFALGLDDLKKTGRAVEVLKKIIEIRLVLF
jgi:tetratricopeptide (TPR) repeat protein